MEKRWILTDSSGGIIISPTELYGFIEDRAKSLVSSNQKAYHIYGLEKCFIPGKIPVIEEPILDKDKE